MFRLKTSIATTLPDAGPIAEYLCNAGLTEPVPASIVVFKKNLEKEAQFSYHRHRLGGHSFYFGRQMNKTILFMRLKLLSGSDNTMWTGDDLHRFLTSDDVEWAVGLGYVAGHLDNIQKSPKASKKPPLDSISFDDEPYRNAADLVLQYLQDCPESRHEKASVLINRAFKAAGEGERQSV